MLYRIIWRGGKVRPSLVCRLFILFRWSDEIDMHDVAEVVTAEALQALFLGDFNNDVLACLPGASDVLLSREAAGATWLNAEMPGFAGHSGSVTQQAALALQGRLIVRGFSLVSLYL
jgi:hypothetical protein